MGYNWNWGNMMGYYPNGGGFMSFIFWALLIILMVAIIRLVWKKGNK